MTVLANDKVNVLQAVNLTMGTSAFLAMADSLPKLFPAHEAPGATNIVLVALLVFWTVKLLVENHRSFGSARVMSHPGYAVFQLFMTVATFLALIAAAREAEHFEVAGLWLMISLGFGLVWLVVLIGYFHFTIGFDPKKYPWQWLGSAVVTVVAGGAIYWGQLDVRTVCPALLLLAALLSAIADAAVTKTFRLN